MLRMVTHIVNARTDYIQLEAGTQARFPNGIQMGVQIGIIAEKQRTRRPERERFTLLEAIKVHRIGDYQRLVCWDGMLLNQSFKTMTIHRHIAANTPQPRWCVVPGQSVMTDENGRRAGEVEQGSHRWQVVMTMN